MRFLAAMMIAWASACTPSADCEGETAELAAFLRKLPRATAVGMSIVDEKKLVVLDRSIVAPDDVVGRPILITVSRDAIQVGWGSPISALTMEEMQTAILNLMDEDRFRREVSGESRETRILVAAEPDAPWSRVGLLLEGMRLVGQSRAQLVFRRDTVIQPPPPSKIGRKLQEIGNSDPSMRATRLAEIIADLFKDCGAAGKLFAHLAGMHPDEREQTLRSDLPQAIRDCGCKCDVKSVQEAMFFLLAPRFEGAVVSLPLGSSSSGRDLNIVRIKRETPWFEAHRVLIDARDKDSAFVIE